MRISIGSQELLYGGTHRSLRAMTFHVKIKRRLTEYFQKLTSKLVLNDALTEFHEENFMRRR
jgi:hypothetical protein